MILDNSKIPEISVVVLCYRAGESIRQFIKELIEVMSDKFNGNYELILIGNYQKDSDDITPKIAREIADNFENVTAVTRPKEGMMGWDMRSGLAVSRGKNIAVIDKANMLDSYTLWRDSADNAAKDYPEISCEFNIIGAAVMNFIRQPEKYEVIVAPNMFGGILSDLGAMLQGGLSFAAQGNINPDHPEFKSWPFGDLPQEIKNWVKDGMLRPFHLPNPRGMIGFYKTRMDEYKWK